MPLLFNKAKNNDYNPSVKTKQHNDLYLADDIRVFSASTTFNKLDLLIKAESGRQAGRVLPIRFNTQFDYS